MSKEKSRKPRPVTPETEFKRPNILLIMADEYRFPIHKDIGGMNKDIKNILGFQNVENERGDYISDEAKALFPGFMKMRDHAVVLKNHTVATTACVPSRAALFTGQYGTKTGVTQTDGVFKSAAETKWLEPNGIPTMGNWFRANDYTTHYFGKCHFAHPHDYSLKEWGFDDWETSFPEPHGTLLNNLGMYRDQGFTDLVTTFLRRKGMALDYDQAVGKAEMEGTDVDAIQMKPWFAVASFTNPHDITTWPVLPSKAQGLDLPMENGVTTAPLGIPDKGTMSQPPAYGTWRFDMNPGGIGAEVTSMPISAKEDLGNNNKPDCQLDYSLKLGIALASKTGKKTLTHKCANLTGLPLALAPNPDVWTKAYIQYYTYLHHVLDQQINRVMETLDEAGLSENTIVVFIPDHGEYGGSHGMMQQKWHSAYQEAIHVPVVVRMPNSSKRNPDNTTTSPKMIEALTSHIDLLPTLLGLSGVVKSDLGNLYGQLSTKALPFIGADLSKLIQGNAEIVPDRLNPNAPNGREAILFTTSDMITEPADLENYQDDDFDLFLDTVELHIDNSPRCGLSPQQAAVARRMRPNQIAQPAELHCVREGQWKLVRYRDFQFPNDEKRFQWELYNLDTDPAELTNLLLYKTSFPDGARFIANPKIVVDNTDMAAASIEQKATDLYDTMLKLIQSMLNYEVPKPK